MKITTMVPIFIGYHTILHVLSYYIQTNTLRSRHNYYPHCAEEVEAQRH